MSACGYDNDFKRLLKNNKFENNYDDSELKGSGTYGMVVKVICKTDQTVYAIKMIPLKENGKEFLKQMREVQVHENLQPMYCVQLRQHWIENNQISSDRFNGFKNQSTISKEVQVGPILYLEMKYCPLNLNEVIILLRQFFNKNVDELLPSAGYYIASKLLIEILESLNSLHNNEPQIIHLDIKPANILLVCDDTRLIRLSDFGLSVELRKGSQCSTTGGGTGKYISPEVNGGKKYGRPTDIYSLGVVIQDLFNFDVNKNYRGKSEFRKEYKYLLNLVVSMMNPVANQRPTVEQILNLRQEWAVEFNSVRQELLSFKIDQDAEYQFETQFVKHFIQNELNINQVQ